MVIQYRHEARRITARRGVTTPLRVRGGQYDKRGQRNEGAAMLVESLEFLGQGHLAGRAIVRAHRRTIGQLRFAHALSVMRPRSHGRRRNRLERRIDHGIIVFGR